MCTYAIAVPRDSFWLKPKPAYSSEAKIGQVRNAPVVQKPRWHFTHQSSKTCIELRTCVWRFSEPIDCFGFLRQSWRASESEHAIERQSRGVACIRSVSHCLLMIPRPERDGGMLVLRAAKRSLWVIAENTGKTRSGSVSQLRCVINPQNAGALQVTCIRNPNYSVLSELAWHSQLVQS